MVTEAVSGGRGSKGGCARLLRDRRNVSGRVALGTKAAKIFES